MTGAKRFIAADNGLLIGLTRGLYVQISLTALDLYDAHTFKVKRGTLDRVVKNEETGLYNDQIKNGLKPRRAYILAFKLKFC